MNKWRKRKCPKTDIITINELLFINRICKGLGFLTKSVADPKSGGFLSVKITSTRDKKISSQRDYIVSQFKEKANGKLFFSEYTKDALCETAYISKLA